MKILRVVGLLGIVLSVAMGATENAQAGTVTCAYVCSGQTHYANCYASLQRCCEIIQWMCPDPSVFEGGDCTDGQNYCFA